MTEQEEIYYHCKECFARLSHSRQILEHLQSLRYEQLLENIVQAAAFQYALIEYAIPFTNSISTIVQHNSKERKYYKLPSDKFIKDEYLVLHNRIITTRNQLLAHNDLKPKDAKISKFAVEDTKSMIILENYKTGLEEFRNVDQIIKMIAGVQNLLHAERPQLLNEIVYRME